MYSRMWYSFIIFITFLIFTHSEDCNIEYHKYGTVCVCDASYCDTVPKLSVTSGSYQLYTTSKSKLGFYSTRGLLVSNSNSRAVPLDVDYSKKHQTIIGFGGAFTDSAGININSLPLGAQEKLLESYFGDTGIEYSLCRVPIGGTDFSTRGYSYDDYEDDITLEHFALQEDDLQYKIPHIQKANELRNNNLKLFASVWSAPLWMKTNDEWHGLGSLKEEYYQIWADYLVKFFEEYDKHNINFWGMTPQNEPADGFIPDFISRVNSMGWTPSEMNQWIGENLGPTVRSSKYRDLKIILHDDARITLPFLQELMENDLTMSYADGAAVHWYLDWLIPTSWLNYLKSDKEGWFFISSEACNGYMHQLGLEEAVMKGSWDRGEAYIEDILDNLEYGAGGWVDWNMALNEIGGPSFVDNTVDSPIIVNETLHEFYKQPMFYAIGHFSKFAIPGSVRIGTTFRGIESDLRVMGFLRPDNLTAVVIYNSGSSDIQIQIEDSNSKYAVIEIQARSINTVLYQ